MKNRGIIVNNRRKITVIHFVYTLFGGVASVAANIINEQHKKGIHHVVVYRDYSDAFENQIDFKCPLIQVPQGRFPGKTMLFGMNIAKYYNEYKKSHPNEIVIAHVHNIQALGAFGFWKNIPLICTLHSQRGKEDSESLRQKISFWLYGTALKRLIKYKKKITSVSEAIIKEYATFNGAEEAITVIHNGAEIDKDNKIPHTTFNIGHVGNLSYAKGWDTIWDAYCLLDKELQSKIHFYSAGNESQFTRKWIEEKCNELQFENVHYDGFVINAQYSFIPKLDVLILASRNEGLGLVQVEAMGYGIPVLGRNTGGICEILKDGYNGYVIKDESDLKDKIQLLYTDKDEYDRLSRNAIETYESSFKLSVIMKKYEKVYNEIIDEICNK